MRVLKLFPAFLLLVGATVAAAQQPPNPVTSGDFFDISGTVTDAVTGKPVTRAQVSLQAADNSGDTRSRATDAAGTFLIPHIPVGIWNMNATKAGYAEGPDSYRKVILVGGAQATQYTFQLQPQAVVHGTVKTEDNSPVADAQVIVFRPEIVGGRKRLQARESTRTDDHGNYRMIGLGEGACFIATAATASSADLENGLGFAPTYYPNVVDPSTAQAVNLRPGQDEQVDVQVTADRAYRIRGRLSVRLTDPRIRLLADPKSISPLAPATDPHFDPRTSSFTFAGVPPGDYVVEALVRRADGREYGGYQQVTVSDHDMEDIVISTVSSAPLAGRIHVEGDTPTADAVSSVGVSSRFGGRAAAVRGSAFQIEGALPPGNYRLTSILAPNWYLRTATQNGRDVLHGAVVITDGATSPPLDLTASPKGASLEATVTWPDGDLRPPAIVTVLELNGGEMLEVAQAKVMPPNNPAVTRPALIGGLRAGDYVVYAWPDPVKVEYSNPDALRPYDAFVQTIHVDEGGQVRAALKLAVNP